MASKDAIKEAILKSSGNPEYGIVVDNVEAWAQAIWELDNTAPAKEVRDTEAKETRKGPSRISPFLSTRNPAVFLSGGVALYPDW